MTKLSDKEYQELRSMLLNELAPLLIPKIGAILSGPQLAVEDETVDASLENSTQDSVNGDDDDDDEVDDEDDDEDEGDEEDSEEGDDDDSEDEPAEDSDEDSGENPIAKIIAELDRIPQSVIDSAVVEAASTGQKEMKRELTEYLVMRGIEKADATEVIDSLKSADLKTTYSEYYARFLDVDGEVHDMDDMYQAKRKVGRKEEVVWCCNGVETVDGHCFVNPEITVPVPKKSKAGKGK